ncbi:hypothetical protein [Adhaeribacter pallidiroseus]|nr:hypothetical protein [Adhaeribacter pallidiroseus]
MTAYFFYFFKKLGFLSLIVLWFGLTAKGQVQYGNEWINYSQTYYKIKVAKSGIYRLDHTYLTNAGLGSINPQNLQLWRRGQEVAVHVEGEADGTLNPGDYLEFYGERNDGKLDREIYKNPQHQSNPYFSLYTDTAAYFLTVSPSTGKRVPILNNSANGLTPEPWHKAERLKQYTTEYQGGAFYGESQLSWGDASEGYGDMWFGTIGSGARSRIKDFEVDSLLNVEASGAAPQIEIVLDGVLRDPHNISLAVVSPNGSVRDLERDIVFGPADKIKKSIPCSPATSLRMVNYDYGLPLTPKESPILFG